MYGWIHIVWCVSVAAYCRQSVHLFWILKFQQHDWWIVWFSVSFRRMNFECQTMFIFHQQHQKYTHFLFMCVSPSFFFSLPHPIDVFLYSRFIPRNDSKSILFLQNFQINNKINQKYSVYNYQLHSRTQFTRNSNHNTTNIETNHFIRRDHDCWWISMRMWRHSNMNYYFFSRMGNLGDRSKVNGYNCFSFSLSLSLSLFDMSEL